MARESNFTKVTTIGDNDLVRVIKDTSSRNMTKKNFVTDIQQLLLDLGFLTASTLPPSVSQTRFIQTFGVNHSLVLTDDALLMDATGSTVTVTLPFAANAFDVATSKGQRFTIKKIDTSATNDVIIDPAGADLIDGNTLITLSGALRPSIDIISDGADWFII